MKEYQPLDLLKTVTKRIPQCWKQMDDFHQANGQDGLPKWPEWCYAPFAAAIAVASQGRPLESIFAEDIKLAQCIAALAPWRINKEVYVVDPDLAQVLYEQGDDLEIPGEFLLKLPYSAFYIEAPGLSIGESTYHGFVVHLEFDVNNGDQELRFLYIPTGDKDATVGLPLHIDEGTISASLNHMWNEILANTADEGQSPLEGLKPPREAFDILKKSLQLILYILASNAEIVPDQEQKTITKRSPLVIRDQYREIRKWDVGFYTGAAIRRLRESGTDSDNAVKTGGLHASPRPHLRRGHWHHFWTGPKNEPMQRKLILKWVSPVAIGSVTDVDELPVVFHKVEKEDGSKE